MKKFLSILAIATVALTSMSCRQDDDSATFENKSTNETKTFGKTGDTIKTDTVKMNHKVVDPDPPVRDDTPW